MKPGSSLYQSGEEEDHCRRKCPPSSGRVFYWDGRSDDTAS